MDKQMKRNKICFGLGTIGRDALYSLVSMYLLVHLTDVVGFSDGGAWRYRRNADSFWYL